MTPARRATTNLARGDRPPLKKGLGQHHLRSGALCRPLVRFLRPAGRTVIEIGPGGGVLTAELLAAGARVVACELDLPWAFHLRRALGADPALSILAHDALALAAGRLPAGTLAAGNLPFNVATAILQRLLEQAPAVEAMAFLLQKEVAERLLAAPGTKAYGALSVLVQARADASLLGTVKPGSFVPPPKVAA
ncbi:MAG: 16S rRNA (adenine(1518)-N(6)/adenine(1519)-N(6))-dimethyltransferase, partial [Acidobacteria bacterium]